MICEKCKQPIDHVRGDMIVTLRGGGEHVKLVFCLECADELILSKVYGEQEE